MGRKTIFIYFTVLFLEYSGGIDENCDELYEDFESLNSRRVICYEALTTKKIICHEIKSFMASTHARES